MTLLFAAAALLAIAGALGLVLARPPVHSVLALVVNLVAVAVLYLSLQAEFLAVAQVIVYAGAVMVLFLFVISLLTARKEPVERPASPLRWQEPAGLLLAGLLLATLGLGAVAYLSAETRPVGEAFGSIEAFGESLFLVHAYPLQLAAIVLMVAVVGVVVLVARRPEEEARR